MRRQVLDRMCAQFWRHSLDAHLGGTGSDDDNPGLGLFYGGMVRKKNVADTVMTSFAITCLVTVLYAVVTYSMAFRAGTPFVGGLDRAFLQGILSDIEVGVGNPNPLAPTIPETVYMCFQMTFAIIARLFGLFCPHAITQAKRLARLVFPASRLAFLLVTGRKFAALGSKPRQIFVT
jgi:ammonia channel protein AmtB